MNLKLSVKYSVRKSLYALRWYGHVERLNKVHMSKKNVYLLSRETLGKLKSLNCKPMQNRETRLQTTETGKNKERISCQRRWLEIYRHVLGNFTCKYGCHGCNEEGQDDGGSSEVQRHGTY